MSATITASGFSKNLQASKRLGRSRKRADTVVKVLCYAATAIGLLLLASILATLLVRGFGGIGLSVFTENTKAPGSNGGVLNANVGRPIQTRRRGAIGPPRGPVG